MVTNIIKQLGPYALIQVTDLKYFKKGRANMNIETRYHVEFQAIDWQTLEPHNPNGANRFNFTSKAEALTYLKSLKKAS